MEVNKLVVVNMLTLEGKHHIVNDADSTEFTRPGHTDTEKLEKVKKKIVRSKKGGKNLTFWDRFWKWVFWKKGGDMFILKFFWLSGGVIHLQKKLILLGKSGVR